MAVINTIPRSAGGEWEWVRDAKDLVRYREAGRIEWTFLSPVDVVRFNGLNLGLLARSVSCGKSTNETVASSSGRCGLQ